MAQKSAKPSRNHLSHLKNFRYLPRLPAMAAAIAAGRGRREIVSPAILIYDFNMEYIRTEMSEQTH
jgi:sirohydrochlorin ferrochelatase